MSPISHPENQRLQEDISPNVYKQVRRVIQATDIIISFSIFFTILALIILIVSVLFKIVRELPHADTITVMHDVALIIVLVKAYRVLLFYFEKHHISIKYIIEISIIAPAIELIFAMNTHTITYTIVLGLFSLGNLILYLFFYEKLSSMDTKEVLRGE
ncbi:MAG: hypothetical protein HYV32_02795 [Candidatus Kerfeldbacteria bacterium]|nr:hypothetical protein [Candidatus Kerfeldbacteria bacterium]